MEATDSTILTTNKSNYLSLLREIDKLLNLSINSSDALKDAQKSSEIETIFNDLAENMESIVNQMALQKNKMFIITILNAIMRISALDGSDLIISRDPFQLVFKKLNTCIWNTVANNDSYRTCASDMLDSMFLNLVRYDFVDICFKRLLSNTTEASSGDDRIDFPKLVAQYIEYAYFFVYYAVFRSYEFKSNYSSLMISLQEFISNCLTNSSTHVSPLLLNVITSILNLLWNLTDKIALIPILIDLGYIKTVIQWIRTDIFASHIKVLGRPIVSIIHNLSRNKRGLKQLRAEKAFDVLMEHKQLITDENNKDLTEGFGHALVALATSDDQSEENKKLILETSESLYQICKEAHQNDELKCGGFHLSELLELLHRAFTNTYVIKHVLENKLNETPTPIQTFAQLLLSNYGVLLDPEPNELDKLVGKCLLKILLQISSYPEYLKELIDNNRFCIIIESLANRPKRDDAKRIWCNIQQIISPNTSEKRMQSMIYVSYDSADEPFCKEFVNELRKKITIPIWVDYENIELSDEMWDSVSPIIRSASVVITLVSPTYGESTDKFQELSYIVATNNSRDENKGLIVVTMEPDLNFKRSWMKDLLNDKTLIPFENDIRHLASKVSEQISVSRKSFIKYFTCGLKNVRKKTTESGDSSADSQSRIMKSVSTHESISLVSTKNNVTNGLPNTNEDTKVLLATRKRNSHPVAADVLIQTGSAGGSTLV